MLLGLVTAPRSRLPSAIVTCVPSVFRNCGAAAARPPRNSQLNKATNLLKRSAVWECLVSKSAGLHSPSTFRS